MPDPPDDGRARLEDPATPCREGVEGVKEREVEEM